MFRDGVPEEDRKRLYQHARLGMTEIDAVNHLVHLGQEVSKVRLSETLYYVLILRCADSLTRHTTGSEIQEEDRIQAGAQRRRLRHFEVPASSQTYARGTLSLCISRAIGCHRSDAGAYRSILGGNSTATSFPMSTRPLAQLLQDLAAEVCDLAVPSSPRPLRHPPRFEVLDRDGRQAQRRKLSTSLARS